jgi:hypothetical protein
MRKTVLALLAVALAGCGDSGTGSALDEALGYLPKDAPLVIVISTDLDGGQYDAAGEILDKLPLGGQLVEQLKESVEQDGVDYEKDVKPLLGKEAVIAVPDAKALQADDVEDFVLALETKDAGKLEEVAARDAKKTGEKAGATLYRSSEGTDFAVKDDVLVVANTRERLEAALERRDSEARLREDDLDEALGDLPDDALARLYVDIEGILAADSSTAAARRIPWVAALRTAGAALTAHEDGLAIDFVVNTEADGLEPADVPVATPEGGAPPALEREGELGFGVRDTAHFIRWAELAAQAYDPAGYRDYALAKRQLGEETKVDVDRDVFAQFTGNLSLSVSLDGDFALRSELVDPGRFEQTLRRVAKEIPDLAEAADLGTVGVATPKGREDFYAIAQPEGDSVVYGVVGDVFVLASDARRAAGLAGEEPRPVEDAKGSVTMRGNAEQLANELIADIASGAEALGASLFTGPLGELTGHLEGGTGGLRGRVELEIE